MKRLKYYWVWRFIACFFEFVGHRADSLDESVYRISPVTAWHIAVALYGRDLKESKWI